MPMRKLRAKFMETAQYLLTKAAQSTLAMTMLTQGLRAKFMETTQVLQAKAAQSALAMTMLTQGLRAKAAWRLLTEKPGTKQFAARNHEPGCETIKSSAHKKHRQNQEVFQRSCFCLFFAQFTCLFDDFRMLFDFITDLRFFSDLRFFYRFARYSTKRFVSPNVSAPKTAEPATKMLAPASRGMLILSYLTPPST